MSLNYVYLARVLEDNPIPSNRTFQKIITIHILIRLDISFHLMPVWPSTTKNRFANGPRGPACTPV